MFRLLAMPSLDKVPVGRESWMSSPRRSTHGKVTKHDPHDLDVTSLRQWRWRVPASVIDAGLAAAVAVAVAIAIRVSTRPGARPVDVFAYALGLMLAALVLVRRRWPVAVLVASAAILHLYYLLDYPGILPAVPLAVALAGAWAAGHLRWSLLVAAWFVVGPILFRTLAEPEPLRGVLNDSVADAALFGAVLLGEAVRTRRALRREHHLLLAEQEKSERLLLNVLPASIAARLKDTDAVIADAFADVTVLFADIVDFTRHSQHIAPEQVVRVLNGLFSVFDQLAKQRGLEKIKTIGDAYMVVGGLPDPRPDHAVAVADMALAMREEIAERLYPSGGPLAVRIGIDTGPVVAGVIGTSKFSYDLWGDTVNTASRMESHGVAGCIQVTARTYERLKEEYRFERRGPIHVKGRGEMVTYVLVARNE
jgi:class 3 adenylate cyclase